MTDIFHKLPFAHLRSVWVAYVTAIIVVIFAAVLRQALNPLPGDDLSFIIFYVAVLQMGWWADMGQTLLPAALSHVVSAWMAVTPRFDPALEQAAGLIQYFEISPGYIFLLGAA